MSEGAPNGTARAAASFARPTLFQVMREPRWIAALVLALVIAAVFAALGRWQAERAVTNSDLISYPTETVQSLDRALRPGATMNDSVVGQRVRVDAAFVPNDYEVIAQRVNGGATGYWVTGHAVVPASGGRSAAGLAVALGWAPTAQAASDAIAQLRTRPQQDTTFVGRLLPSEEPSRPAAGDDPREMTTMAVPALYNLWHDVAGSSVYSGYVVASRAPAGLDRIDSPRPIPPQAVNWLNVFYAVEWAVFAGFAIFLWYRLAKDAWEKRLEDLDDAAATPAAAEAQTDADVH